MRKLNRNRRLNSRRVNEDLEVTDQLFVVKDLETGEVVSDVMTDEETAAEVAQDIADEQGTEVILEAYVRAGKSRGRTLSEARGISEIVSGIPTSALDSIADQLNMEINGAPVSKETYLEGLLGIYLRERSVEFSRLQADIGHILSERDFSGPLNRRVEYLTRDILPLLTGTAAESAEEYLSRRLNENKRKLNMTAQSRRASRRFR